MDEQMENLYDLLSGFYTLLWAQLDSLFDEHRWARAPYDEPAAPRTPEHILGELSKLKREGITLPMSMEQFKGEADRTQKLVADWKCLQGWLKQEPSDRALANEVTDLRREIQDRSALFEERALAFASLLGPNDTTTSGT